MLSGYLACDGSFYENSSYPALFNAIGYTYAICEVPSGKLSWFILTWGW